MIEHNSNVAPRRNSTYLHLSFVAKTPWILYMLQQFE